MVGGRSSGGRLARSRMPAAIRITAQASASSPWPSGRSNSRTRIRNAAQQPAARMTVPSPNGRWNWRPSARCRRNRRTPPATSNCAASTKENGPRVLAIRSSAPTPATRCSTLSRSHVRRRSSERAASGKSGLRLVPEGDLVLALLPAEVDLATVPDGGEVHEPPLQVAKHDGDLLQLHEGRAELDERLGDDPARRAAA